VPPPVACSPVLPYSTPFRSFDTVIGQPRELVVDDRTSRNLHHRLGTRVRVGTHASGLPTCEDQCLGDRGSKRRGCSCHGWDISRTADPLPPGRTAGNTSSALGGIGIGSTNVVADQQRKIRGGRGLPDLLGNTKVPMGAGFLEQRAGKTSVAQLVDPTLLTHVCENTVKVLKGPLVEGISRPGRHGLRDLGEFARAV